MTDHLDDIKQFDELLVSDVLTSDVPAVSANVAHYGHENLNHAENQSIKGSVVARGTGEGLILRLDGRISKTALLTSLIEYVESRKAFFAGQEVTLEWLEARPQDGVLSEISSTLQSKYQMMVKASRMFERLGSGRVGEPEQLSRSIEKSTDQFIPDFNKDAVHNFKPALRPVAVAANFDPSRLSNHSQMAAKKSTHSSADFNDAGWRSDHNQTGRSQNSSGQNSSGQNLSGQNSSGSGFSDSTSLFDGVTALGSQAAGLSVIQGSGNQGSHIQGKVSMQGYNAQEPKGGISEALLWDEPDARIIRETLRGGQKIESEHSVVIVGDVNSGAEIVAGGDIFVLGRLRGVAHAGAYDESGAGRKIFALQMQPTQLRIGSIISQGSDENGGLPEIAKIEGNMIVVEPYGFGNAPTGRTSGGRTPAGKASKAAK